MLHLSFRGFRFRVLGGSNVSHNHENDDTKLDTPLSRPDLVDPAP